jgi:RNA ligase
MFTHIENIEQIIKHFEFRKEFTIGTRDGFTVIDYNYILPDTFDDPVRLEGRGIKFCSKTGNILARPFHKFFNLGERPDTQFEMLPWHLPFVVQEKYDGSMIHPAIIDGRLVLMTRKGITNTAIQAMQECMTPQLEECMRQELALGHTPMYEYVSPNNRIVIEYTKPALRFLAMRKTVTGAYSSYTHMFDGFMGGNMDPRALVDTTRRTVGKEGVVICWPYTGQRIKLKADEYVMLHRAIDVLGSEKRILDVILENKDDDLCAAISENRATKVRKYAQSVRFSMRLIQQLVESYVGAHTSIDQKTFAMGVLNSPMRTYSSELFACHAGKLEGYDIGKQFIQRHSRTQADLDRNREIINIPKLQPIAFNTGDV